MSTDIALIAVDDLPAAFESDEAVDATLEKIASQVVAFVPNVKTAAGRKEIASMAYKVARSKSALDEAGKKLGEEYRAKIEVINGRRRTFRDMLEEIQRDVRRPLDEWEDAEKRRIEAHKANIFDLKKIAGAAQLALSATQLREAYANLDVIVIDGSWEEYEAEAAEVKAAGITALRAAVEREEKREAEAAEKSKHLPGEMPLFD